jgi:hypothetical protein
MAEHLCPQPGCDRAFVSVQSLQLHRSEAHGTSVATTPPPAGQLRREDQVSDKYTCTESACGRSFPTAQGLSLHRTRVHGSTRTKTKAPKKRRAPKATKTTAPSDANGDRGAEITYEQARDLVRGALGKTVTVDLEPSLRDVLDALAFLRRTDVEDLASELLEEALEVRAQEPGVRNVLRAREAAS